VIPWSEPAALDMCEEKRWGLRPVISRGSVLLVLEETPEDFLRSHLLSRRVDHAIVCTHSQVAVCNSLQVASTSVPDLFPVNERRRLAAEVEDRQSDLFRMGVGRFRPYPRHWDYEVDCLGLFLPQAARTRHLTLGLLWRGVLSRGFGDSRARQVAVVGSQPRVGVVGAVAEEWSLATVERIPIAVQKSPHARRPRSAYLKMLGGLLNLPFLLGVERIRHRRRVLFFDSSLSSFVLHEFNRNDPAPILGPTALTNGESGALAHRLNGFVLLSPLRKVRPDQHDRSAAEAASALAREVFRRESRCASGVDVSKWWLSCAEQAASSAATAERFARVRWLWRKLDRLHPEAVVVNSEYNDYALALISWARFHESPIVSLHTGFESGGYTTPGLEYSHFTTCFLSGPDFAANKAMASKSPTEFVAVGSPKYESWRRRSIASTGDGILVAPSDTTSALFPDVEDDFWNGVCDLVRCYRGEVFTIRPHHLNFNRTAGLVHDRLCRSITNWRMSCSGPIETSITTAKIVVTSVSTVGLDAMVLQRPVVIFDPWPRRSAFSDHLLDQVVSTPAELVDLMSRLLSDSSYVQRVLYRQEEFCRRFAGTEFRNVSAAIKDRLVGLLGAPASAHSG
jgi:hypothetical protein